MRSTITYEESHYSAIISTRLTVYIMEPTELFGLGLGLGLGLVARDRVFREEALRF